MVAPTDSILEAPYAETPLVQSSSLSKRTGTRVMLKLEQLQPAGSFKSRGLGNLVYQTVKNGGGRKFHFFASSGGNAGFATATAAQQYGQKCTVCVPTSTDKSMVKLIASTGATVVQHGDFIAEADKYLREVLIPASKEEAVYSHPFDNELVWDGNATIVDELVRQCPRRPDAIVLSVGGGGLYNGIVQGLHRYGWTDVPMVAVETEGCASLNQSLKNGGDKPVYLDKPATIARSLATATVTPETVEYARGGHPTSSVVVSDGQAAAACVRFCQDHRLLVEAACGTALAPLYTGDLRRIMPHLDQNSLVVVVVCGGAAVSYDTLREYASKYSSDLYLD